MLDDPLISGKHCVIFALACLRLDLLNLIISSVRADTGKISIICQVSIVYLILVLTALGLLLERRIPQWSTVEESLVLLPNGW